MYKANTQQNKKQQFGPCTDGSDLFVKCRSKQGWARAPPAFWSVLGLEPTQAYMILALKDACMKGKTERARIR
jgi:hypothetical protein